MEFVNWLLEVLTAWLPPIHQTINIETPLQKLALFVSVNLFGFWLYYQVLKPGVKIVWALLVGLVCAISLHALTIYAAYKFKRLNKIRWWMLIPYLLSRWLDFTFAGYKGTTIRSQYFIWRGPFTWTLVAQSFKTEPTVDPVPESDDLSDDDEWPDDEDYAKLTMAEMRESDRRDEADLNYSCFDKHPNEHPDDALLRKLHEPIIPKDTNK
jgi:hypothetical protein